mgnify:CR=1 FL=1
MLSTLALTLTLAAPPIQQPMQAVLRLRSAKPATQEAAVKDVVRACRGKLRHSLRGHAALTKEVKRWSASKSVDTRRRALDLDP